MAREKPKRKPRKVELEIPPISVRVPQAVAMTGFSRSRIYELIKDGELQIAKDGNCTFILVESLRALVESRRVQRAS